MRACSGVTAPTIEVVAKRVEHRESVLSRVAQSMKLLNQEARDSASARLWRHSHTRDCTYRDTPTSKISAQSKQKGMSDDAFAFGHDMKIVERTERVVSEIAPPRGDSSPIWKCGDMHLHETIEVAVGGCSKAKTAHATFNSRLVALSQTGQRRTEHVRPQGQ